MAGGNCSTKFEKNFPQNNAIFPLFPKTHFLCLFYSKRKTRPKMPFAYVVNVYKDMSLSKGHLRSRGEWGKHLKINRKTPVSFLQ